MLLLYCVLLLFSIVVIYIENVKIWVVLKSLPIKPVSYGEYIMGESLSNNKAREYYHSRGYLRYVLSKIYNIPPLNLPLNCPPGKPPKLDFENGAFISISHCKDCTLLGLSNKPIGVDIERADRNVSMHSIVRKYYTLFERNYLNQLNYNTFNKYALKLWTAKEAVSKCVRTNLYEGIKNWEVDLDKMSIKNMRNKDTKKLSNFLFKEWEISVVFENSEYLPFTNVCFLN